MGKRSYALINQQDYSVFGGSASNKGFVILEDSVLIFDTGFSTKEAIALDSAISKVTRKRPRYIINSHDHSDHVFGNSYFSKKYHGLSIISHRTCRDRLRRLGASRLEGYRKSNKKIANLLSKVMVSLPAITYYDFGRNLNIEGTDILLIHPENGAHTLGDTILAVPDEGVMFLGDVLFNGFFPNLQDANLEGWIDFLDDIDLKTYTCFVPGHGGICDINQLVRFREYLSTIRDRLLNSQETVDGDQLLSLFETGETGNWKFRHILQKNVDVLFTKSRC